jgi:hypothetical protein
MPKKKRELFSDQQKTAPIIWCEHYQYFIDLSACQARAQTYRLCHRCLRKSQNNQQLSLPFMDCPP